METVASNTLDRTGGSLVKPYIMICLAAFLALAWQFIYPGYYNMYGLDAAMVPKYVPEFNESFRQGILYPRWMAEDFRGYGSPMFVLYSPLLYIMSSAMNLSGLGLAQATAVLKLLSLWAGGVFLFHLMRKRHGDRAALIASLFYILLPTRVYDIYYHNTPAGRFGEAFMPMTLFFVSEMDDGPMKRKDLAGFGLSYAGLILSHLASAYLFTPFIVLYGLLLRRRGFIETALKIGNGIGAGILLSSFFFVPVLFERGLVHLEYNTNLYELFRFEHHVVINGYLAENHAYLPLKNSLALEVGVLLVFLYITIRKGRFRFDRDSYFYGVSVLMCLFMMSFLSGFLWEGITALRTINLPSRFSAIYLIFVSALFGITADRLLSREARPRWISALSVALLVVVFSYGPVMVRTSHRLTDDYYAASKLADRPDFQPEYLPKTVDLNTLFSLGAHDPRLSSTDRFSADIRRWGYVDRNFVVDSPRGARLRVKTFYFPGWRAWVDGKEVPLTAEEKTGAIVMAVPPGRHDVGLRFTNTPARTWGAALSLLMFVILVFPRRLFLSRDKKSSYAGRPNG